MGKSCLVDHSATLRFTLPFNLIKATDPNEKGKVVDTWAAEVQTTDNPAGCPPADKTVGTYLTSEWPKDNNIRHMCFLEALFAEVTERLEDYTAGTREQVARKWYECLKEGVTPGSNDTNRSRFYEQVVSKAQEVCKIPSCIGATNMPYSWKYLVKLLIASGA